jgi:HPt (histidine-containing phosphotransfer) domain-containing protein
LSEIVIARDIFDRLREATANSPEVLAELCREYVAEARSTIAQLHSALAEGDARQMHERAHYLKGSSMMLGAKALWQCCASLEQMGRDADLAAAAPMLDRATLALQAVEETLAQEVGPAALPNEGSAA